MGCVTSPNATVNRKPKLSWGMRANLALSVLVICLGPILFVVGTADPGQATALGFESDGVFYRGIGTVLTGIFGSIGLFLAVCYWLGRRKDRKKRAS